MTEETRLLLYEEEAIRWANIVVEHISVKEKKSASDTNVCLVTHE